MREKRARKVGNTTEKRKKGKMSTTEKSGRLSPQEGLNTTEYTLIRIGGQN
jgi:hypothetical protein